MDETREKLRADFYAKTDISLSITPENWKKYAEYLETLAVDKINNELLRKNESLIGGIEKAMTILENSIISR